MHTYLVYTYIPCKPPLFEFAHAVCMIFTLVSLETVLFLTSLEYCAAGQLSCNEIHLVVFKADIF